MNLPSVSILGVSVHCITSSVTLVLLREYLSAQSSLSSPPRLIFTPNPEIILAAYRQPSYARVLAQADLRLPDGHGLMWASSGQLTERVTGTDIMLQLLELANESGSTVGFVLARDGLSSKDEVQSAVRAHYPNCRIVAWYADELLPIPPLPQMVFVALGFPRQEEWCVQHRDQLHGVRVLMTVGGGVDYMTGRQTRAPLFFRQCGLEWLWRLIRQPKRLKRIWNATVVFPYTVWRQRRSPRIQP